MLTEQEVARRWSGVFRSDAPSKEDLLEAEALLDELRPESPLRHRLGIELDELKRMMRVAT